MSPSAMPSGRKLAESELERYQEARAEIESQLAALAADTELARGE